MEEEDSYVFEKEVHRVFDICEFEISEFAQVRPTKMCQVFVSCEKISLYYLLREERRGCG